MPGWALVGGAAGCCSPLHTSSEGNFKRSEVMFDPPCQTQCYASNSSGSDSPKHELAGITDLQIHVLPQCLFSSFAPVCPSPIITIRMFQEPGWGCHASDAPLAGLWPLSRCKCGKLAQTPKANWQLSSSAIKEKSCHMRLLQLEVKGRTGPTGTPRLHQTGTAASTVSADKVLSHPPPPPRGGRQVRPILALRLHSLGILSIEGYRLVQASGSHVWTGSLENGVSGPRWVLPVCEGGYRTLSADIVEAAVPV